VSLTYSKWAGDPTAHVTRPLRVNLPVCEAENIPVLKSNHLHGVVLVQKQDLIITLVHTSCYLIRVVSKYCTQ